MRIHKSVVAGMAGLSLVLTLSACSSNDTAEAKKEYCDANSAVQTEVASLKTLVTGGTATVDDVKKQVDKVKEAASKAADKGKDLADSVKGQIESADEAFTKAVDAIPGDATLQEASTQYQAAVAAWEQSVAKIRSDAGC